MFCNCQFGHFNMAKPSETAGKDFQIPLLSGADDINMYDAIPCDRVFGAELEVQFLMQECSNIVVKNILIKFIHFIC